jgi:hypothetical protein
MRAARVAGRLCATWHFDRRGRRERRSGDGGRGGRRGGYRGGGGRGGREGGRRKAGKEAGSCLPCFCHVTWHVHAKNVLVSQLLSCPCYVLGHDFAAQCQFVFMSLSCPCHVLWRCVSYGLTVLPNMPTWRQRRRTLDAAPPPAMVLGCSGVASPDAPRGTPRRASASRGQ